MTQHHKQSKLQDEIDSNLKRAYDEVLNEDIPDRFNDLLSKLKEAEQARKPSEGDADGD